MSFAPRVDGRYTQSEQLKCRAYLAFVHAEIEHYLEEIVLKKLEATQKRWRDRKSAGQVLSSLLAFEKFDYSIAERITDQRGDSRLETFIFLAILNHRKIVEGNHGIRHKNLSKLFTPIGVNPLNIEEPLIVALEEFGKRRGSLVHSGNKVSIARLRDPFSDEESDVAMIVSELAAFDKYISSLK